MPGAYAHITLATKAMEKATEDRLLDQAFLNVFDVQKKFCQLGSVGPDYPYFDRTYANGKSWADLMHYDRTGTRVRKGVEALIPMSRGEGRDRAMAWLFGFASHVIADATIHPVVALKVGAYRGHEAAHRKCELHQDVYIFTSRMDPSDHRATFLEETHGACSAPNDTNKLDPSVKFLWLKMFEAADADIFAKAQPDCDDWHERFRKLVVLASSVFVEKLHNRLDSLFGTQHQDAADSYLYPTPDKVDRAAYVNALAVPGGRTMRYDEVFDKALRTVLECWQVLAASLLAGDAGKTAGYLREWNLDTGEEPGPLTFWP